MKVKENDVASEEAVLLRVLIAMQARVLFPEDQLRSLVSPGGAESMVRAFNLCDGTRNVAEAAREAGVDPSNLRKSVTAWVRAGIVHRIPDGSEVRLLHVYPLPEQRSGGKSDG